MLCDLGLASNLSGLQVGIASLRFYWEGVSQHPCPWFLVFKVVRVLNCSLGVGLGREWPFPASNILCFFSSKSGLKGCVPGQVAGEVCGSLGALEEWRAGEFLPDPPLPQPLGNWLPGYCRSDFLSPVCSHSWAAANLCLDPATAPRGAGDLSSLPSSPYSTALSWPHGPGRGELGTVPASAAV